MWCLSHPITWCLFRIRHVTADWTCAFWSWNGSRPSCLQLHLTNLAGGKRPGTRSICYWRLGLLNKGFYGYFPSIHYPLSLLWTQISPRIFINVWIWGHLSMTHWCSEIPCESVNQLQHRRRFDLPFIRCVYDCAAPMERPKQGVVHALMTLLPSVLPLDCTSSPDEKPYLTGWATVTEK